MSNGFFMGWQDQRKRELVNFRVDKRELELLRQRAAERNSTLSDFIRERIFEVME